MVTWALFVKRPRGLVVSNHLNPRSPYHLREWSRLLQKSPWKNDIWIVKNFFQTIFFIILKYDNELYDKTMMMIHLGRSNFTDSNLNYCPYINIKHKYLGSRKITNLWLWQKCCFKVETDAWQNLFFFTSLSLPKQLYFKCKRYYLFFVSLIMVALQAAIEKP